MVWILAVIFCVVAAAYSSVGFAGGSTYTALLLLSGVSYALVPLLSLTCNLIVSSSGAFRFARLGFYGDPRLISLIAASAPAAFLGGLTPINETVFIGLLGSLLLIAGLRLGVEAWGGDGETPSAGRRGGAWALFIGAGVGYVSGLAGIGGGIFLAPILHGLRWDSARQIAAACTAYITVNSIAALAGKLLVFTPSDDGEFPLGAFFGYWPLFTAVILGGVVGGRAAVSWFSPRLLKAGTAILILLVAVRLLGAFALRLA